VDLKKEQTMKRRRRHPRGFFIIWGSRNRLTADGTGSIQAPCPNCRHMARLDGMKSQRWFTLYFIPIFPVGSAVRFTQCAGCKAQFRANLDEMRAALGASRVPPMPGTRTVTVNATAPAPAAAQGGNFKAAIALFNSMRETPADSAKLAQLLRMYLNMNEPGEAASAGRSFPLAVEGSDVCCQLLAQAYMQLGDRSAAARHAAAAVALNPNNAQAQSLQSQAMAPA